MTQSNNIPQGYKDSPLGIIPQEWEVKRLGEVCRVNQGLQIPIEKRLTVPIPNSYKYITIQYLNGSKGVEYILNPNDSVICNSEDILMTRTGNTGIVVTGVDGVFHNNFFKINFDRSLFDKNYLVTYLTQPHTQHTILVKAGTSTIPDLNHKDFYSINIPLPPLPEQQRIAEVLGTWDVAIEKQGALVDKLTERKRALMQQLLTAKKRLPNFSEPWETVRLGEVAEMQSGGTPKSSNASYYGGNIHWASISDISKSGKYLTYTERCITDEGLANSTARVFKANTVLYAMYASLGKTTIAGVATSTSQAILGITPNIDCLYYQFLYYVLSSMEDKVKTLGQCGTQSNLNKEMVMDFKIKLPSVIEQTAIAQILTTADREIEGAKAKLESLRSQKRGLMQQLLSGKKRIKI